jgi:hypothetical protein
MTAGGVELCEYLGSNVYEQACFLATNSCAFS